MYGLIVLGIFLLYVAGCIGAAWLTVWLGRKYGWKLPWLWGFVVLVVYNVPVGQYVLPPIIALDQYCEQQAGFWLYKTPEQWQVENPGVAETLTVDGSNEQDRKVAEGKVIRVVHLNQRFDWVIEFNSTETKHVHEHLQKIVDLGNGEVLGKKIDFFATASPLYVTETCFRKDERGRWQAEGKSLSKYIVQFKNLGGEQ